MITLEEFDTMPDDGLKHEIHKNELVTVDFPIVGHNRVVRRVYDTLGDFLSTKPIGEVFWTNTGYLLSGPGEPVTLVGPDLTYIPRERAARLDENARRIQGAAELTIEVVSPSDRPGELPDRVAEYLKAGGLLVWVVYPDRREVRVFEASGAMRILGENDTIEAPELLPGFSARVASFFE